MDKSLGRPPVLTELEFLIWLRDESGLVLFDTRGNMKPPSNAELRRWIRDRAVWVNGEPLDDPDALLYFPITSLVLFPKGKRRITVL